MTAIAPDVSADIRASRAPAARVRTGAAPHLTAAPWAGAVISVLFVASIVLFAFGVLAFGPAAGF